MIKKNYIRYTCIRSFREGEQRELAEYTFGCCARKSFQQLWLF